MLGGVDSILKVVLSQCYILPQFIVLGTCLPSANLGLLIGFRIYQVKYSEIIRSSAIKLLIYSLQTTLCHSWAVSSKFVTSSYACSS